jgi:hypothetical protein
MPDMQIDLAALANYVENTLDCSPEYEDDQGAFSFEGYRVFFTRKRHSFKLEIDAEVFDLPRF